MSLLAILVTALLTRAVSTPDSARPTSANLSNSITDSIDIQVEGYPSRHHPEEALPFSNIVVRARITDIGKARWNTPDGLRPADWHLSRAHKTMIYTPFAFETQQVLKGNATNDLNSHFAVVGGQVGEDRVSMGKHGIDLYSDVMIGDEVILFLRTSEEDLENIAPYTYVEALRVDGNQVVAGCHGSREARACRTVLNLSDVLMSIASWEEHASP